MIQKVEKFDFSLYQGSYLSQNQQLAKSFFGLDDVPVFGTSYTTTPYAELPGSNGKIRIALRDTSFGFEYWTYDLTYKRAWGTSSRTWTTYVIHSDNFTTLWSGAQKEMALLYDDSTISRGSEIYCFGDEFPGMGTLYGSSSTAPHKHLYTPPDGYLSLIPANMKSTSAVAKNIYFTQYLQYDLYEIGGEPFYGGYYYAWKL